MRLFLTVVLMGGRRMNKELKIVSINNIEFNRLIPDKIKLCSIISTEVKPNDFKISEQ